MQVMALSLGPRPSSLTAVAWVGKFLKQRPMKLGSNMDRNISNLAEKFKEAEEHINTYYEVEECFFIEWAGGGSLGGVGLREAR